MMKEDEGNPEDCKLLYLAIGASLGCPGKAVGI